jgi:flagellar biosynthesis protein FlhB
MAEDRDDSQKTEEPTQRRLEEAKKRGDFANSREIGHGFVMLGGTLVVVMLGPAIGRDLFDLLRAFVEKPELIRIDHLSLDGLSQGVLVRIATVLALPMLLMVAAAFASGLAQHGFTLSPEKLKPDLERISPLAGAKRLFSMRSLVEFAKGIAKIAVVGAIAAAIMMPAMHGIELATRMDASDLLELLRRLATRLMVGVLIVVVAIAAVDFFYQRLAFLKKMRMSRQEVRDELKQAEGDPHIRARLRQIRQERARKRMMAAVPSATVVVANPTHYAVALKYELDAMAAPMVVAKGADNIALRIRAVAEENKVPVFESPPLAQALYAGVEIGDEIPPEHYRAVAEIVGYVLRLQGKLKPQARPAAAPAA